MTDKNHKKQQKPVYEKPQVKKEPITQAQLGKVCNGMSSVGGRKATAPCTILFS